jgi:hypothetical protein
VNETAGAEDDGAEFGDAAATPVVEIHKRQTGPGHRIFQERNRRSRGQAMRAAEMQEGSLPDSGRLFPSS